MIVCPWKEIGRYESVIPGLADAVKAIAITAQRKKNRFIVYKILRIFYNGQASLYTL